MTSEKNRASESQSNNLLDITIWKQFYLRIVRFSREFISYSRNRIGIIDGIYEVNLNYTIDLRSGVSSYRRIIILSPTISADGVMTLEEILFPSTGRHVDKNKLGENKVVTFNQLFGKLQLASAEDFKNAGITEEQLTALYSRWDANQNVGKIY